MTKLCTYLWTSLLSLFIVICQVILLFGSRPGCEISKPCFLTIFKYLEYKDFQPQIVFTQHLDSHTTGNAFEFWYLLLCIKMLHAKILIPNEDVVIRCHNVRVQKAFSIPPSTKFHDFMSKLVTIYKMKQKKTLWYVKIVTNHLVCFLALIWIACFDHSKLSHSLALPS